MNAKVLTLILGLIMLVPAGYAAGIRFGSCPSGYECAETPDDGGPFPPHAVTGHTIYANFIRERVANNTLGLPTDFAAIAGYFADIDNRTVAIQRECVVWFNGHNLDQRPNPDQFPDGENAFPSDEDQPQGPGGVPNHDESYQDYDFDRDIENCLPAFDVRNVTVFPAFAVAVEAGDCDPGGSDATSHRFRGHLDFVDPNNVYHEVQEYDYQCYFFGPGGGLGYTAAMTASGPVQNAEDPIFGLPGGIDDGGQWTNSGGLAPDVGQDLGQPPISDFVKDMFPWTYTDAHNENGCAMYETPADGNNQFDFGHKCNGSIQDLFLERMWMTPIHNTTYDPTIDNIYNFALQIDTCAGWNIYEGPTPFTSPGKDEMGVDSGGPGTGTRYASGAEQDPQAGGFFGVGNTNQLDLYHDVAYHTYYGAGLDDYLGGWPLFDVCTDGSSFSFDDTPRGRTVHSGKPAGIGDTDIMRGNSYDFDQGSDTVGKHRTNCRHNFIDWPYSTFPPGVQEDCYPEDHKTAQIDIYVYYDDPTGGLWALNSNGMTGINAYSGHGTPTGPNDFPPY